MASYKAGWRVGLGCLGVFYLYTLFLHQPSDQEVHRPEPLGSIQVPMEHCDCARSMTISQKKDQVPFNKTTCGMDAFVRGSGQKVVSFSLYGDSSSDHWKKKAYFEGVRGNLELMRKYFPEWIMRIYFDLEPGDPVLKELCNLACHNDVLDLCHARKLPGTPIKDARKVFPMIWRFFPSLDLQVGCLKIICRVDLEA